MSQLMLPLLNYFKRKEFPDPDGPLLSTHDNLTITAITFANNGIPNALINMSVVYFTDRTKTYGPDRMDHGFYGPVYFATAKLLAS